MEPALITSPRICQRSDDGEMCGKILLGFRTPADVSGFLGTSGLQRQHRVDSWLMMAADGEIHSGSSGGVKYPACSHKHRVHGIRTRGRSNEKTLHSLRVQSLSEVTWFDSHITLDFYLNTKPPPWKREVSRSARSFSFTQPLVLLCL